jgi:hypothetical protein
MPEKRPFPRQTRRSNYRDARLIIVATEGTNTEKQYFDDLGTVHFKPWIRVEVLSRVETASAPEYILEQLNYFKAYFKLSYQDELWLVIDVDRWGDRKLAEITALCQQKGYFSAISNPCFELWLLLHIRDLSAYPSEILAEFRANRKQGNRSRLEIELVNLLGSYNKSNLDTTPYLPRISEAIERARRLDRYPDERWPGDLGSRVYLLVESIMDRG